MDPKRSQSGHHKKRFVPILRRSRVIVRCFPDAGLVRESLFMGETQPHSMIVCMFEGWDFLK